MSTTAITIRHGLRPGDIGELVRLQGVMYAEEYGFDVRFEAYVAGSLGDLGPGVENGRSRLWIAEQERQIVGGIGVIDRDECAQLRWFFVHRDARGQGLGARLLDTCIAYCREAEFTSIYLWTVSPLHAAAHLYLKAGFQLTESSPEYAPWGVLLSEQRYDLTL